MKQRIIGKRDKTLALRIKSLISKVTCENGTP